MKISWALLGGQIPDDFASVTSSVSSELNGVQTEILQLQTSLSNLILRFKRETVNIGVAGAARQGKSTLLQSISGLKDTEIPTSDALPCTGAKSHIFHFEGQLHARIDFYKEDEFLKEIIHAYFDRLQLPWPSSPENFSRPLPPLTDQNKILNQAVYEKLEKIHKAFPTFRQYLSKPSEIVDLKDIPEYVTQTDGRTKYLAVKTANIFTKFPQKDVTGLCLVDLPGLEAAQGHEKKIVDSLEHEVDAVILVKKPSPQGTQYDTDDFNVIELINNKAQGVDLTDWLFLVLNILSDRSNEKQAQLLKSNPPTKMRYNYNILIGDCSNTEQAEKLVFSPVLTHLEQNLEKIDRKLVKALSEKMTGLSDRISKTVEDSKGKLKPDMDDKIFDKFIEVKNGFFKDGIKKAIKDLLAEFYRAIPGKGNDFKKKVEEICSNAEKEDSIFKHGEYGERTVKFIQDINTELAELLHNLRSALSAFLAKHIDEYLTEQVNKAVDKILNSLLNNAFNSIQTKSVTDGNESETVRKNPAEIFDKSRFPMLYDAFDYVARFNFSYHSHFHYRVRLEMWKLDTYDPEHVERFAPKDLHSELNEVRKSMNDSDKLDMISKQLAGEIDVNFWTYYCETLSEISKKIGKEMKNDPACAIYSLVEEIGDRLSRRENIQSEWDKFLFKNKAKIWPKEFGQYKLAAEFCLIWESAAKDVLKCVEQVKDGFGKMAG